MLRLFDSLQGNSLGSFEVGEKRAGNVGFFLLFLPTPLGLFFDGFRKMCLFFIAEFSLLFIRTGLRLKHQSSITSLTFYRYN